MNLQESNMQDTTPAERKPYTEPQLIEYGDLETLTTGNSKGGIDLDGQGGSVTL